MIYALYGFLFGMLIPYMARRFSKFMPATFAYGLWRILKQNKKIGKKNYPKNPQYKKLVKKYFMRSLGWAVVTSSLSYLLYLKFGLLHIGWYLIFVWVLLLLTEIDYRMYLLPDLLTIPLLLLGFTYAVIVGGWVNPAESAIGALLGYFIPTFANLLIVWKKADAFGGGDIKLLSAIGAWFGVDNLLYVIILSSVIFLFYALAKKQKSGAFGPAIAIASIIIAFYSF